MKKLFILTICSLLLLATFSCSPQKRLARLTRHYPELVNTDTLYIKDTVISKSIKTDTLLLWSRIADTIVLQKDRLRIQIIKQYDTLRISAQVEADTIILERKIPVEKIKYQAPKTPLKTYLISAAIGFGLCVFFYTLVFIRNKK